MKLIVSIIIVISISLSGIAQEATIYLKNGESISSRVQATSQTHLYTKAGNFKYSDIDLVDFTSTGIRADIIKKLTDLGLKVNADGQSYEPNTSSSPNTPSPIILNVERKPIENFQIIDAIEKFREQRTIGKTMQLIGILASTTALATAAGGNNIEPAIYYGAAAISGIGFIVDLDAGRHLRIKK